MHTKPQIMRTATFRWRIILNYVKKKKIKCKREGFALNSVLHIHAYILISINLINFLNKETSTVRQFISNSIRDAYTCQVKDQNYSSCRFNLGWTMVTIPQTLHQQDNQRLSVISQYFIKFSLKTTILGIINPSVSDQSF